MAPQYATWSHSSHREAAHCNDCHVPHNNTVNKYYFKAKDGLRHSTIFTMRAEPQVIFILEAGQRVVKQNCIRCHEKVLIDNRMASVNPGFTMLREDRQCWDCHREETVQLIKNVYDRQDKIIENRNKLEEILVRAHIEAKAAWDYGAVETQMNKPLQLIRQAQWRWDYSAAGHGNSFHSPVEISRIIASGIGKAQEARLELARVLAFLNHNEEIPYPDIATKQKAQQFIGLEMAQLKEEKATFLQTIVPKWLEEADKRQKNWYQKP
jgi:cytochrome c nitrite reductase small subunit